VDGGDPRVVERGEDLRLALEPGHPLRIAGQRGREDLDRDLAVERRIPGSPDFAHATSTQAAQDQVGPQHLADHRPPSFVW
jgi:hypothetical protein